MSMNKDLQDPYREKDPKKVKPNNPAEEASTSTGALTHPPVTKATAYDVTGESASQREDDEDWADPLSEPADTEANAQTNNQLIAETNVPTFRILRKLNKHIVRAEHNSAKLAKLLQDKHLPKGLSPKRFPLNLPDTPIDIQLKWERAHVQLSRTLTEILHEYWTNHNHTQKEIFENLWSSLREEATEEEQTHITSLLNKTKEETIQRIHDAEKKKIYNPEAMETEETEH